MDQSNVIKIFQLDNRNNDSNNINSNKKMTKRPAKKKSLRARLADHFVFCFSVISISGLKFIVEKNITIFERLIWIVSVATSCAFAWIICYNSWLRYQIRPVVITLERDYYYWNFTVPPATICLRDQLSDDTEEMYNLIKSLNVTKENATKASEFFKQLYNGNLDTYEDMDYVEEYASGDNYLKWLVEFGPKLGSEVSQSHGEAAKIQTVVTEFGLCYTYNSYIAEYSSPEYWDKGGKEAATNEKTETATVNYEPAFGMVAVAVENVPTGYLILFHGPNEVASLDSKNVLITPPTLTEFHVSSTSVVTSPDVEKLKIQQRNCRLTHESNLAHSPVYSYNLCRRECRIRVALQRCNCTPFYYPRLENEPVCGIRGMQCLGRNKNVLKTLIDDGDVNVGSCNCLQNCNNEHYVILSYQATPWFLGTFIKWQTANFPEVRYKRELIFSGTDLLVQIGGTAGLFLGCSILSVIEIVYFLTIRLVATIGAN